jgi:3'-5' exoribonuclease
MEAARNLEPVARPPGPTVAELTPGRSFRGRYAVARKDRQTARNGAPYLALELRDRSGTITARVFREVDRIGARFERGDAVEVHGRAERFRGQLSAELEDVRRLDPAEVDAAQFLPAAYRDREELEGFLEHLTREVHDPGLRATVEAVLFAGRWRTSSAGRPAPAAATTPTSAACSSTRSRSPRWSRSSPPCTRASTPTC